MSIRVEPSQQSIGGCMCVSSVICHHVCVCVLLLFLFSTSKFFQKKYRMRDMRHGRAQAI